MLACGTASTGLCDDVVVMVSLGSSPYDESSVEGDFVPVRLFAEEMVLLGSRHILGIMGNFKGASHLYCLITSYVSPVN